MEIKKFNIKSEKHSADAIKGQKLESIMQTKDFQSVFSTFYNAIKKTLVKMSQLRKQTGFLQMKNIDLCQALKGTVFKTQLNQLWDIKQIISSVEIGFASLQWYDCDQQAAFVCEGHQEAPFKLFCEDHFEEIGLYSKSSINLTHDLKLNVMMLNELERHLVSLQEKIEYFSIKKDKKNPVLFQKFKGLIDDNFKILNTLLKNMATKSSLISQKGIKTIKSENKSSYENLSFIKDNWDKCRNTIFQILSMIPEVWEKMEADSFVQVIVDSDKGVPLEEERKESLVTSVPDHIYGKEYKLVHIPTQSFVQFKEFEKKIKANCEAIETCIEVLHFIYSSDHLFYLSFSLKKIYEVIKLKEL